MENKKSKIIFIAAAAVLAVALVVSVTFNILQASGCLSDYRVSTDEVYTMEAGILYGNLRFANGQEVDITYDFQHADYAQLKKDYKLEEIAQNGSEFDKALHLMNEFAPRLAHKSDYDNSVECRALPLLQYSLNNKSHGINCRAKAQIFNEMCLSLEIYARKVWLMPYSTYDDDCHVVNEVWDTVYNKWVMLDISNNQYWVDEGKRPLSVLEIREKGAKQEFCTPVSANDNQLDIAALREKHQKEFVYIMKNLVYTEYLGDYSAGESKSVWLLYPQNATTAFPFLISEASVKKSPITK